MALRQMLILSLVVFADHAFIASAAETHFLPEHPFVGGYPLAENRRHLCPPGQVPNINGLCILPEVTEHVFLYDIPQQPKQGPPPSIPRPKINNNILLINLPENQISPDPIVIPPPQQKNIVYVLNKNRPDAGTKVIELPSSPKTRPDVYFVNYDHGENPILPTGEDLRSVLAKGTTGLSTHVLANGPYSSVDNGPLNNEVPIIGVTDNEVKDSGHVNTEISLQNSFSPVVNHKVIPGSSGRTLDSKEHKTSEFKTIYYGDVKNRRLFHP